MIQPKFKLPKIEWKWVLLLAVFMAFDFLFFIKIHRMDTGVVWAGGIFLSMLTWWPARKILSPVLANEWIRRGIHLMVFLFFSGLAFLGYIYVDTQFTIPEEGKPVVLFVLLNIFTWILSFFVKFFVSKAIGLFFRKLAFWSISFYTSYLFFDWFTDTSPDIEYILLAFAVLAFIYFLGAWKLYQNIRTLLGYR